MHYYVFGHDLNVTTAISDLKAIKGKRNIRAFALGYTPWEILKNSYFTLVPKRNIYKYLDSTISNEGVAICTDDFWVNFLNRNCPKKVDFIGNENLDYLLNKRKFYNFLADLNVPYPDIREKKISGYVKKSNGSYEGTKRIGHNYEMAKNFFFQRYVRDYRKFSLVGVYNNGFIFLRQTEKIISSHQMHAHVNKRLKEITQNIFSGLRYSGFFEIEFLVKGKDVFCLEVNPRLPKQHSITNGNIIRAYLMSFYGISYKPNNEYKFWADEFSILKFNYLKNFSECCLPRLYSLR